MGALKDSILKELRSTVYGNGENDEEGNVEKAFTAMAKGIFNYISDSNNHTFTGFTNGTEFTVPIPTPVVLQPTDHTLLNNSESLLLTDLKRVRNGAVLGGIQRIFFEIYNWLTVPPFNITQAKGIGNILISIIPLPPAPAGVILFPTMISQGNPAKLEIERTSFKTNKVGEAQDQFWSIMEKYIMIGLNTNIIPPIPASGLGAAGFPYVGITTAILTFT